MQQLWKAFYHQALFSGTTHARRALPILAQQSQSQKLFFMPQRRFAELEVKKPEEKQIDIETQRKKIGVDMNFSEQKHAYVLTFPWNFPEIIQEYEHRGIPAGSYWNKFVFNTNAIVEFQKLYREFHQYCALPDWTGLDQICEPRLADYVKQSVKRIHFHGLGLELANLRVTQNRVRVLKAEISYGLDPQRSKNLRADEYSVSKKKLFGSDYKVYIPKEDDRSFLDNLDYDHKPYCVAITVLIESPMKLYVQNQNYSAVLFGSNDEETVKNVVRFESNFRWLDFIKVAPVGNKPPQGWIITDFNNVLNENPYFKS